MPARGPLRSTGSRLFALAQLVLEPDTRLQQHRDVRGSLRRLERTCCLARFRFDAGVSGVPLPDDL